MSTITFTCYACNQVLKVGADKAGKKAKCIKCGTILTIPVSATEQAEEVAATPEPPEGGGGPPDEEPVERSRGRGDDPDDEPRRRPRDDDEDDDRPRRRRRDEEDDYDDEPRRRRRDDDDDDRPRRRRDEEDDYDDEPRRRRRDEDDDDYDDRPRKKKAWGDWSKVRIGVLLEMVTSGMLMGYGGVMFIWSIFFMIGFLAQSTGMAKVVEICGYIGAVLLFLLQIPAIVGYVFCLFAPNKNGSMALCITTLSVAGVSFILKFIFVLLPLFRSAMFGIPSMGLFPVFGPGNMAAGVYAMLIIFICLLWDSEYVLFPFVQRALGKSLKDRYVERGWTMPMILAGVFAGLKAVAVIFLFAVYGSSPSKGMFIVSCILLMGTCGVIIAFGLMYLRYNGQIRQAI